MTLTRHTVINLVVALMIAVGVGTVFYLEWSAGESSATTTVPSTTVPPTTSTSTTTTTTTTTTVPPSTTTTLPPATDPLFPQGVYSVAVVNAGTAGERVQPTIDWLRFVGYGDVRGLNGAVPLSTTTIFYAPDLRGAAERLAIELDLDRSQTAPLAEAPPIAGLGTAQLVVYLGGA